MKVVKLFFLQFGDIQIEAPSNNSLHNPKSLQLHKPHTRTHKMPSTPPPTTDNEYEPGYAIHYLIGTLNLEVNKQMRGIERLGNILQKMLRKEDLVKENEKLLEENKRLKDALGGARGKGSQEAV